MSPSAYLPTKRAQIHNRLAIPNSVSTSVTTIVSALLGSTHVDDPFRSHRSIYTRLLPFYNAADNRLDPCPELNHALSELVAILQGKLHVVAPSGVCFVRVAEQACRLIDNDEELKRRAHLIRDVAERAESRLELFYVELMLKLGQKSWGLSNCSLHNMTVAERVAFAANAFPYIGHYSMMVAQEARLIASMRTVSHVVFCGSGPLPLSGALLAAHLNTQVTLVDRDEQAVHLSRLLVSFWEERGVLPSGRITVRHLDAAHLRFHASAVKAVSKLQKGTSIREDNIECEDIVENELCYRDREDILPCDVLFIAALIPNNVKETLVKAAAEMGDAAPLVVLRSAHGLTARLAYPQAERSTFSQHLRLFHTVVPATHALSFEAPPAVDGDTKVPLDWFPSEILNSLEFYGWSDLVG